MKQCWRWFGPQDPIGLDYIKQAGATGIVTALHHHPESRAWSSDDVIKRKNTIEAAGLRWEVCESISVPSAIKLRSGKYRERIANWKDSLAAVANAGVKVINYNFMPVVDWTRTNLSYRLPTTGFALRFDMVDFVAYDVFVLKRTHAVDDYSQTILSVAEKRIAEYDEQFVLQLEKNIIAGLPGGDDNYSRDGIRLEIARFEGVTDTELRGNLFEFIQEITPVAQDLGVALGIHADDPPFRLFGLSRVVSTADDFRALLKADNSSANGITFCTGSMGARPDNDLPALAQEFAPRIHFAHLRNTTREQDGSFYEAEHLDGDTDMVKVVFALLDEEARRKAEGRTDSAIPMRPDHGHLLADDISKVEAGVKVNPGYSYIGRLKGLAELRGVMCAHSVMKTS